MTRAEFLQTSFQPKINLAPAAVQGAVCCSSPRPSPLPLEVIRPPSALDYIAKHEHPD